MHAIKSEFVRAVKGPNFPEIKFSKYSDADIAMIIMLRINNNKQVYLQLFATSPVLVTLCPMMTLYICHLIITFR